MPRHIRLSSGCSGWHTSSKRAFCNFNHLSIPYLDELQGAAIIAYLIQIDRSFERTAEEFATHLIERNADNRYMIYGYFRRTQDLHMLDQMVFAVRRLMQT
jgi:hypothetical protein